MPTWTLVYYEGRARASGTDSRQGNVEVSGRMISSQIITVGTTVAAVPDGTQLILILPDSTDGDGFYWISPTEDNESVDATHNRPIGPALGGAFEEWRNNYEFQHVAALP